jgi:catechol 2,3-dioxygenase-like lactoylglutathione lyase family enzyme
MSFGTVVPILRSFDQAKTEEFYRDWLGFTLDWEHRFGPGMPLYQQFSRDGLMLHLSEHHGDATPGSHVRVQTTDLRSFHAELTAKNYKSNRPGLETPDWGGLEMTVIDAAGNRITFHETVSPA